MLNKLNRRKHRLLIGVIAGLTFVLSGLSVGMVVHADDQEDLPSLAVTETDTDSLPAVNDGADAYNDGDVENNHSALPSFPTPATALPESALDVPPSIPTNPRLRSTPIINNNMILDSSKVNVYSATNTATWLPKAYQHYWNWTKATISSYLNSGATSTETTGTGLNKTFTFKGFPLKSGTGYTTHNVDFGYIIKNVNYGGQDLDINVHMNSVQINNIDPSETIPANYGQKNIEVSMGKGVKDGIDFIMFSQTKVVSQVNYYVTFYKAGTTTQVSINTPFLYGDQEGAKGENNRFTDFPNSVTNGLNFGESLQIVNGYNSAKYPRFDFYAANATKFSGTGLIPDLGVSTNYESGVFKYKMSSSSNDLVFYKMYGYKDNGAWNFSSPNVNDFQPRFAQWSFLFSGSQTNVQKHANSRDRDIAANGDKMSIFDGTNNGYWNMLGFAQIVPSEIAPPTKYVSDSDETLVSNNTLSDPSETYDYTLQGDFPVQSYGDFDLKSWKLTDTIPAGVTADLANVTASWYDEAGNKMSDAKSYFDFSLSGQNLTITAKATTLSNQDVYGRLGKPRFTIPVRITDVSKVTKDSAGKIAITNTTTQSGTYFNGTTFSQNSNQVKTTAPDSGLKITKSVDKTLVEDGTVDPAKTSTLEPITYTVAVANNSVSKDMDSVKLLDVMPQLDDGRNTVLGARSGTSGSYKVTGVYFVDGANKSVSGAQLYYKNKGSILKDSAYAARNVFDSTGKMLLGAWSQYDWKTVANLETTSAMAVYIPNIPAKTTYYLKVTIVANNASGAVLNNTANANSIINEELKSNQVTTKIYSRSLTGKVWYDDNYNGLQDKNESFVPDVPVKLYRTSLIDNTYQKKLVTADASGTAFVDASGNSLIKTDKNGVYTFNDLLEGDYIVEFVLNGQIQQRTFKVTKYLTDSGKSDATNSKVPQNSLQITAQPQSGSVWSHQGLKLDTVSSANPSGGIQVMANNNLGLLRSSTLALLKYEAGSLVDSNGNGSFDADELAKAKVIAGASFEVYKGKLTDYPKDGTKNPNFISSGVTGKDGKLNLADNLFPDMDTQGNLQTVTYTAFETKAPNGHELAQKIFYFDVSQGNQTIPLYVDNHQVAELPYTGGKDMLVVLLIALSVTISGFLGVGGHYLYRKRLSRYKH
ncbi:SpaA isopeptide-forming pilin-related protein [Lactococcus chungangensis]|uniref:SpaA isopeptide-forming pilin-related protein n=1 Tax=Pseudolactococcus chungangensis TaxID=451457 RepID=UPI0028D3D90C|nr:SdrD B-like domain-containing protein [Lactococcus chungangensis]